MQIQLQQDEFWMQKALRMALLAQSKGEVPVGAILVSSKNTIVAQGYNRREELQSPLGHAEILTLHKASQKLKQWRLLGCTLYVTLEPCVMCTGAIIQSRISRVVYAASDPKAGACGSCYDLSHNTPFNHHFLVTNGVLADKSKILLQNFFQQRRQEKKSLKKKGL